MAGKLCDLSLTCAIPEPLSALEMSFSDKALYRLVIDNIGDGFYGSSDPTNSVKALKEVVVLRIRLQSHQEVHFTMLQFTKTRNIQ